MEQCLKMRFKMYFLFSVAVERKIIESIPPLTCSLSRFIHNTFIFSCIIEKIILCIQKLPLNYFFGNIRIPFL